MSRRPVFTCIFSVAVVVFAAAQAAATHTVPSTCFGQSLTISGTDGNDPNIQGTPQADVIASGDGVDEIFPHEAGDRVCGNGDNDFSQADGGADRLQGGPGADVMRAEAGNDGEVQGNDGGDAVYGGLDNDFTVRGGPHGDLVEGGTGSDYLYDGGGDDTVDGGVDPGIDRWYQCADGISDTFAEIETFFAPSSAYC